MCRKMGSGVPYNGFNNLARYGVEITAMGKALRFIFWLCGWLVIGGSVNSYK